MTTAYPVYALGTTDLATTFNLTPRRIRQYVEDRELQAISPGRYDMGWLAHLRIGERVCARFHRKPDTPTLVAIGWLAGMGDQISATDKACLAGLFKRNGKTAEDAAEALGEARALLRRSY